MNSQTTVHMRTSRWNLMVIAGTAAAVVVAACLIGPLTLGAADGPNEKKAGDKAKENLGQRREGEVGRNEELSFQQSKVSSQMSELEERMFRLSDALKSLEPENASRLLIGLKYAREELIQLQMKEIQNALSTLKYNDAAADQKQLLAKLHRLEQLLLSPDLDFQLQLERLRLMREILRRLDAAIKEEERERLASDSVAEAEKKLKMQRAKLAMLAELVKSQTERNQTTENLFGVTPTGATDETGPVDALAAANAAPAKTPEPADLESLVKAQGDTRESAKPLEAEMPLVADAAKSMDRAVDGLKSARPVDGYPHQEQALQQLKKAIETLQEEERDLEAAISERRFQELRKDQAGNRKTTDGISETAIQLGDAGAAARLDMGRAATNMMSAEGSLGGMLPNAAADSQDDAVEALKAARAKLAAEEQKLMNRLRGEVKKRTLEGIVQMLEGQIVIRQSTERLGPRLKDGQRSVLNSVVSLSTAENKLIVIGDGLVSLVEETEFGIALPAALRSILDGMTEVKDRLAVPDASPEVIAAQKQIEEDLQTLLDAMRQLPSNNGNGRNGNNNGRSDRERQLNQIIAELKMVRMLQVRVNRDTLDVDGKRPAELKDLGVELARRIEALQGRQEDVRDVTERIAIERADDLSQ